MSTIQWTQETWNPVAGCSIVSTECKNCYAMRQAHRLAKMGQEEKYGGLTEKVNGHVVWNGRVKPAPQELDKPLQWRKPRMIFVNSMSDLFHADLPTSYIAEVFEVMLNAHWHTYQVLTKRPQRMQEFMDQFGDDCGTGEHIWLGTSVGYGVAKERIEYLRRTTAAIRFLSCEPLLEDLGELDLSGIHWVIIGGESGPGARPFDLNWARNIIRQCREQNVKVFVKQLGTVPMEPEEQWRGRVVMRLLSAKNHKRMPEGFVPLKYQDRKAGEPAEWPEDLRIREFPAARAGLSLDDAQGRG